MVLESFSHYVNAMYPHQEHPAYRVRFERDMNANTEEVDALIEAAREEAKHPTCNTCARWSGFGLCHRWGYTVPTSANDYCSAHTKEASDD